MCCVLGFEGLFNEVEVDGFVFCVCVCKRKAEVDEEKFLGGKFLPV